MYYIFFVNNIQTEKTVWTALDIMEYLLNKNIWAFPMNSYNLKNFTEGDRVVVYLAGKSNRCFAADFTIACKTYDAQTDSEEPNWLEFFPKRIKINDISQWDKKIPIHELINKLEFIKDKKNYGLYFRNSTKSIQKKDYDMIIENKITTDNS